MSANDEQLIAKVMEVSKSIRFATVCDKNANILSSKHREHEENILTLEETHASLERALHTWEERDKLHDKIGHGRYAVVAYEKIKRVTVPLKSGHMLFFSVEGDTTEFINDVMKVVEQ